MENMDYDGGCNAAALALRKHQEIYEGPPHPNKQWTAIYYYAVAHQIAPDPREHYKRTFHPSKLLRDHCDFLRGFEETYKSLMQILWVMEKEEHEG